MRKLSQLRKHWQVDVKKSTCINHNKCSKRELFWQICDGKADKWLSSSGETNHLFAGISHSKYQHLRTKAHPTQTQLKSFHGDYPSPSLSLGIFSCLAKKTQPHWTCLKFVKWIRIPWIRLLERTHFSIFFSQQFGSIQLNQKYRWNNLLTPLNKNGCHENNAQGE